MGRNHGTTLFMTLLAAFQLLLYRYSRQEDVAMGTPWRGGAVGRRKQLIGFFVNMLVLLTELSGRPNFGELLGRVRETALGAFAIRICRLKNWWKSWSRNES